MILTSNSSNVLCVLKAYEATPEPYLLLAGEESEFFRLLAIVLEGFGYNVIECRRILEVEGILTRQTVWAAIVDSSLPDAPGICHLVKEQGDWPLLLLSDESDEKALACCKRLGAIAWLPIHSEPERVLLALRAAFLCHSAESVSKHPPDVTASVD